MSYEDYEKDAASRAASMRFPGWLVFPKDMPPVMKSAANGIDSIVDVAATKAKYGLS